MSESTNIAVLLQKRVISDKRITTMISDRIRPSVLKQGDALPAIRYKTVFAENDYHLGGASGSAQTRVQFDCCSESYAESLRLSELVTDILDGFAGYLGTNDAVHVYDCTIDNEWDTEEPATEGGNQVRYVRKTDFLVSHSKPTPSLTIQE